MSDFLKNILTEADKITLLQIKVFLMRGKVDDAERLKLGMHDQSTAQAAIDEFKKTYAGMPHGQWAG